MYAFKTQFIHSNEVMADYPGAEWFITLDYKKITLDFSLSGRKDPIKALANYSGTLLKKSSALTNPEKTLKMFKSMLDMKDKTDAMKMAEGELYFMLIHKGLITTDDHKIIIFTHEKEPVVKTEAIGECCICLEEKPISWKCGVCKDGIICRGCRKGAKKSCEGCPVCRTI